MSNNKKPSFAFLVLTLNHEEYIIEHLESVKYLVETYAGAWDVDLIVNDDASSDQTRSVLEHWLAANSTIFRDVKTLFNKKNLGTCASVDNMLKEMRADRCKLTAGDDVYSFENIFELTKYSAETAMLSGQVLYLLDEKLKIKRVANILVSATQAIYHNKPLLHRFKHLSYNNAPNIIYATECIMNPSVRAFLKRFDVVEDWPLQVAIGREYPRHQYALIDQVLVYYRRTPGSTYIVSNERFVKDKLQLYDNLIQHEPNTWERIRLKSRRHCFGSGSKFLNIAINLDFYIFVFNFLTKIIYLDFWKVGPKNLIKHQVYYEVIKGRARNFHNGISR